jgi:xylan 1,4-beta-xylosidase
MSWATTDGAGNVQVLLWDFTHTLPEGVNNQQYFVQDLPAQPKGETAIRIGGLREGRYQLRVSQVGYRRNDAYTAYLALGSPAQLTRAQVETLKAEVSGSPLRQQEVRVGRDGGFSVRLPMRENDVYLVELSGF